MTTTVPPLAAKHRLRSRLALVAFGVAIVATNAYFLVTARSAAQAMEARAIAGDFPTVQLQVTPTEIIEDGRVYASSTAQDPTGYVASTHLVPAGKYQAVLLADDGIEKHKEKAKGMMVIGARDASGHWFPATAAAIARRVAPTTP